MALRGDVFEANSTVCTARTRGKQKIQVQSYLKFMLMHCGIHMVNKRYLVYLLVYLPKSTNSGKYNLALRGVVFEANPTVCTARTCRKQKCKFKVT